MATVDGQSGYPRSSPGRGAVPAGALAERLAEAWRTEGFAWVAGRTASSSPRLLGAPSAATPETLHSGSARLADVTPARPTLLAQTAAFATQALAESLQTPAVLYEAIAVFLGGCVLGIVAAGEALFVPPPSHLYYFSCPQGAEDFCRAPLRESGALCCV